MKTIYAPFELSSEIVNDVPRDFLETLSDSVGRNVQQIVWHGIFRQHTPLEQIRTAKNALYTAIFPAVNDTISTILWPHFETNGWKKLLERLEIYHRAYSVPIPPFQYYWDMRKGLENVRAERISKQILEQLEQQYGLPHKWRTADAREEYYSRISSALRQCDELYLPIKYVAKKMHMELIEALNRDLIHTKLKVVI